MTPWTMLGWIWLTITVLVIIGVVLFFGSAVVAGTIKFVKENKRKREK